MENESVIAIESCRGNRGPPPWSLMSMQEAATKSLTAAKSVDRLKRLHWSLKRLYQIFIAHIPLIPIYELKMAFIATRSLAAGYVVRSRLVLMLAEGASRSTIKRHLRATAPTISRWKQRLLPSGIECAAPTAFGVQVALRVHYNTTPSLSFC
jgi:hypothetical protein